MKWIKIVVLFLALITITKYAPLFQDKGGLILIDGPLAMLWYVLIFSVVDTYPAEMKWGSKEWWEYINKPRSRRWIEAFPLLFSLIIATELFFRLRFNQSFLAKDLSKLWAWVSSLF